MASSERRKHPRLSIQVAVDVESGHNFYAARTRDVSTGGLFIETDARIAVGTELEVDLKFLSKHVRVASEVAWELMDGDRPVGVGVRFLRLEPHVARSIRAFMALRDPLHFAEIADDDDPPT